MTKINFTVFGTPVAQGRPRATTVDGRVRMYDPKKSRDYKDYIRLVASEHRPQQLLDGPISLKVYIFRPIPKSFSKKKRLAAESGDIRPITKPDADNYIKAIKDALKSVIWRDDSQVVDLHISKYYSDSPRITVEVTEIAKL